MDTFFLCALDPPGTWHLVRGYVKPLFLHILYISIYKYTKPTYLYITNDHRSTLKTPPRIPNYLALSRAMLPMPLPMRMQMLLSTTSWRSWMSNSSSSWQRRRSVTLAPYIVPVFFPVIVTCAAPPAAPEAATAAPGVALVARDVPGNLYE